LQTTICYKRLRVSLQVSFNLGGVSASQFLGAPGTIGTAASVINVTNTIMNALVAGAGQAFRDAIASAVGLPAGNVIILSITDEGTQTGKSRGLLGAVET
jgi:hypothetical protein